jgi:hypothetical protein
MSGQTRPRILNLERIGDVFLNRLAALLPRDLHDILGYLSSHRGLEQLPGVGVRAAVVDGLNVVAQAVPDMTVQVSVGLALVPAPGTSGVVPTPQTSPDSNYVLVQKRLVTLAQPIDPPPPASFRWDLIELGPDATDFVDDSQIVDLYDVPGKKFLPTAAAQPVMIHGEGKVFYRAGLPGATLPPPTPGRVPIAAIFVFDGMGSVVQDRIFDLRPLLAEYAVRGRSSADSSLDVPELAIDLPVGGTPAGAQKFSLSASAVVRGVGCAFTTHAPLDLNLGRDFLDFCDRTTRGKIFAAAGPDWLYAYLVAADDQGYRLSRTNVPAIAGTPSGNRFSHAGVLVWSDVPPSLAAGGSLAPSAPLALPELYGNGRVSPGVGRAVCIGCAFYGAATFRFPFGLRAYEGVATFMASIGVPLAGLAPVVFAEAMFGTIGTSAVSFPWPATAPAGPLTYDVEALVVAQNPFGAGRQRAFSAFEYEPGSPAVGEKRTAFETVVPNGAAVTQHAVIARGLSVGRVPAERATRSGFLVRCQVNYGGAAGGSGLAALATAHTANLLGYRWPNGAVIA